MGYRLPITSRGLLDSRLLLVLGQMETLFETDNLLEVALAGGLQFLLGDVGTHRHLGDLVSARLEGHLELAHLRILQLQLAAETLQVGLGTAIGGSEQQDGLLGLHK